MVIFLFLYLMSITAGSVELKKFTGTEKELYVEEKMYHLVNSTAEKCYDWSDNNPEPDDTCTYTISNKSRQLFINYVQKKYEVIVMRLTIEKLRTMKATKCVIQPDVWIWTSSPELYLKLPVGYDVWSFGTLSVSVSEFIHMDVDQKGDCDLLVGEQNSTIQLARTFKVLGETIENQSYFCYSERIFVNSHFLYLLCLHVVCPVEAIGYRCCRYTPKQINPFNCLSSKVSYDFWWWLCPFIVGIALFAYVPILLMSQAEKLYRHIHSRECLEASEAIDRPLLISKPTGYGSINDECPSTDSLSILKLDNKEPIILETNVRPVTLTSIIVLQIMKCFAFNTLILSRITRALFPLVSLSLVALNTTLLYVFHKEFVTAAVKKGVPMGFPVIIAGFHDGSVTFLRFLGGPYITCLAYVIGGAILISIPRDFSHFLQEALPDNRGISTSLLTLDQASIEKFGYVQVSIRRGYHRVQKQMVAQCFMLLNPAFWKNVVIIQVQYWKCIIDRCHHFNNNVVAGIEIFLLFIPYILSCVLEVCLAGLYYGLPIFNFTHTFVRAYFSNISRTSKERQMCIRVLWRIAACLVSLFAIYIIYIFSIVFIESFLFLARMVVYTYTGMFARPAECYGYIVFGIMVIYYLWESVNKIGNVYQTLLKDVIFISHNLQAKSDGKQRRKYICYIDEVPGIPEALFDYVIDRHKPRMKELLVSAVKVFLIIILILFSIQILVTFNRAKNLFLLTHIFQAIFICMVPKLLTSCCAGGDKQIEQKYYRRELELTIDNFWRKRENLKPYSESEFKHLYFDDSTEMRVSEYSRDFDNEFGHVAERLAEMNV